MKCLFIPRSGALKPHWHPVLTLAPHMEKRQLPQTSFPLSAGKILGGIIRDLTGFEASGGYLYGFCWAEPKYKKGHDLLF